MIVVGCKLGEIATKRFQLFDGSIPLIHLEVQPEEIGRTTRCDMPLVGDARLGLEGNSSVSQPEVKSGL